MLDVKSILDVQSLVWIGGIITVALTTLIQNLSKKYKPWTWLAQQFGKAINKETLDKLDDMEKKINRIEERDISQDAALQQEKAKAARRRILRCSDEIRSGIKHSEEFFNDVMDDITFYKQYCRENPKFENERAVMAIRLIEQTYEKCHKNNNFL